ncbi:Proteasome subunit alpha type-4 [Zancudomyces culisetae]|uniref:Proteasome subunit alpha type-4 n=1 Tax=Zancudomyces culisetae TaxID=1213189 RepID=A0A1R1PWF7_ZANCU|nr:Proteasome subunit alpha type-4 [Zancudomyces culisetae]|eukprot:OMH85269.1 Proteasome subunit alpha type-4 [Zancudomyces culisetae]
MSRRYDSRTTIFSPEAGITSDANLLINEGRVVSQGYLMRYDDLIPVENLVGRLCDIKQGYTQFGGLRPFGVSFVVAGWDPIIGFQLYQTDPAGNYSGWKATCVGENSSSAQSILKQEYKKDEDIEMSLQDAVDLACKIMVKLTDTAKLDSDNFEFATLSLVDGTPKIHQFTSSETDSLLKKHIAEKESKTEE